MLRMPPAMQTRSDGVTFDFSNSAAVVTSLNTLAAGACGVVMTEGPRPSRLRSAQTSTRPVRRSTATTAPAMGSASSSRRSESR
jgi:hypothetical protein